MTRTQRSITSFISSLLLQFTMVGMGVVSTPLLLHWLGDERYGAFRSVTDWMGHLKIFELGLGGSLMPLLAIALGQGDRANVLLTLAVGIRAYFRVTLITLTGAIALSWIVLHLVPVRPVLAGELQFGYWIGLLSLLWIPLTPFRLLSDASQRTDFINLTFIVQSVLITTASLGFAYAGIGIPGQFLAVFLGAMVVNLLWIARGLRQYPGAFKLAVRASAQSTQPIQEQLSQLSIPTLLFTLSGQIGLFTDNLVIAYFMGSASVVPFVMTQRLMALVQMQVQGVGNSTWAALAELYAKGEIVQFNQQLVNLTKLVVTLGLVLIIPIAIYNPQFVQLWVGAERFAGWQVNGLAASNTVLQGVLSLWGWCFCGTGNIVRFVPIAVVGASVNFAISLLATSTCKTPGPLLGTFIASVLIYLWWVPYEMQRVFGTSPRALLSAIARPLGAALLYVPVAAWIAQFCLPSGWIQLGIAMVITALPLLGLVWLTVLEPTERQQWSQRFKQLSAMARRVDAT